MVALSDSHSEQTHWLVCHDCGAVQQDLPVARREKLVCARCGCSLRTARGPWLESALALSLSALVLFVACNLLTFVTVEIAGQSHSATLLSGAMALIERDRWLLSGLVLTTTFLYPLFEICALLYVLVPFFLNRRVAAQGAVFRYLVKAQPWSMLDVFFLGALVTIIKMGDLAEVTIGAGGILFFALVVVVQMAYWRIDKKNVWNWLNPNNCFTRDENDLLYDCGVCHALVGQSVIEAEHQCPRCLSPLHKRKANSLTRTTALLIAATVLYIPANLLPIMDYEELGIHYINTIYSGVVELVQSGLWGIAAIVFIASLVVPVAKLAILYYLVWAVKTRRSHNPRLGAWLYRLTEIVGRWSMVDVFVVTLLTAVVRFGFIGEVEPGPALLPFAAVVVLTMLAADTFDPRLLWDTQVERGQHRREVSLKTLNDASGPAPDTVSSATE